MRTAPTRRPGRRPGAPDALGLCMTDGPLYPKVTFTAPQLAWLDNRAAQRQVAFNRVVLDLLERYLDADRAPEWAASGPGQVLARANDEFAASTRSRRGLYIPPDVAGRVRAASRRARVNLSEVVRATVRHAMAAEVEQDMKAAS